MTSIIIGDIVNSQQSNPKNWLPILKRELRKSGPNPGVWEIFKGDSFEMEVTDPALSLLVAIKIKAAIKCIRKIDVRMAIGIGHKSFHAARISEANGPVFVYASEAFEGIVQKGQNLAIAAPSRRFSDEMNVILGFALIAMDKWSVNSAELVYHALSNPKLNQKQLGDMLGIQQNAVSNRSKRAHLGKIRKLLMHFQVRLKQLV